MDRIDAINTAIHAMTEESHRHETIPHSETYIIELKDAVDELYKMMEEINV
jgi:hypothetical protein|tara:strand:- start:259 stop:411 length:153 start_codon:yes stop_codon:yes gene_type:complete